MALTARLLIAPAVAALLVACAAGPNGTAGSSTARSTEAPAPSATATLSAAGAPAGPTRALFFGDSYIVGGGYTGANNSMAAVAARRLDWQAEIRGAGGTGFVSGNPEYGIKSFLGQIQDGALDVGAVDWLVIEGGGNDKNERPGVIERHAVRVLRAAERRHPEARLVLVGTLDPTVDDFSDTDGVIGALARAAERRHVPYINAQRWLEGRQDLVGPDYDHPLPAGHRVLGRKLARALRALG